MTDRSVTASWRVLLAETVDRLAAAHVDQPVMEARWIVEEASGLEGSEWILGLDGAAPRRCVAHLDHMVERRRGGEPIQYVLGRWGFRTLDVACDRRALIPRPETEQVVELAVAEFDRVRSLRPAGHRPVAVDLGTGTGVIALSVASERPATEVWGVDRSADALALARANLAGLGMAGTRVRLVEGSWFSSLPPELAGSVDLVVTNPPYVAQTEDLPPSVADWEPVAALVPGPSGLEAYEAILVDLARWLAPQGAFVAEIGATQGEAVADLLGGAGFAQIRVERDLAGHDRVVVARRPGRSG